MALQETPKSKAIQKPLSNRRTGMGMHIEPLIDEMIGQLDASEITITFRDKFLNEFQDMDELISLLTRYFEYLPFNGIKEILLVAEYGETSRIHFHGIIRATCKEKATLLQWLKKRFGRTTIRTIRDIEKYREYLLKENPEDYIYKRYL